jgi:hypothetical protein
MRQQLRLRVILPVAVLALLGAGVGAYATGGGGGGDDSEFVVTHEAKPRSADLVPPAVWAKRANAVCVRAERQYRATSAPSLAQLEPALVKAIAISAKAEGELAGLGFPRGRKALARQFGATSRATTAAARRWLTALRRGDGTAFRAMARKLDGLDARFDRLARRLGAHACSTDAGGGIASTTKEDARAILRYPARALNLMLIADRAVVVVFYAPGSRVDGAAVYEGRAAALSLEVGFLPVNTKRNSALAKLAEKYGVHASPAVLVVTKGPRVVAHFDGFVDRETVAQAVSDALR